MAESYGYYSYGDVKAKWLQGTPSMGSTLNNPNTQINLVSKNAFASKTEISKDYDTAESFLTVSKNAICNGTSLVKSANILFNTTEMDVESKEYPVRIHDTKTMVVNTTDMGFYEITSVGQIAKYDLNISATPSESMIKINDIEQSSYNGYETEEINYEVSCDEYATKKGSLILLQNTDLEVELLPKVTIIINVDQEDAIIYINGIETNTLSIGQGESVTYEVICDGYQSLTDTFIVNEDMVLDLELEEENIFAKPVSLNETYFIKSDDNSLWGCGYNTSGQIGIGTTTNVTTFTKITDDVKKVRAYMNGGSTWVIKNDNSLWGCGYNGNKQQGDGTTTNVTTLTKRMDDVKDVYHHAQTWVIKNDNSLWGCGYNNYGQQGSGSTSNIGTFTKRMDNVKYVGVTDDLTLVLKNDGTLWGAGKNGYGSLGTGTTSGNQTSFKQVASDVKSVTMNYRNSWIIKNDNSLWGCGQYDYGQLGNNNSSVLSTFTKMMDDAKIVKNSLFTTWVLKNDGTLWGTGYNNYGQQGDGTTTNVTKFTKRMDDVKFFDTDYQQGSNIVVLKNDGTLWGCGYNTSGQLGIGTTTNVTKFTQITTDVKKFYTVHNTLWVIKKDNSLWGCGNNSYGQMGNGSTTNVTTLTKMMENVRW